MKLKASIIAICTFVFISANAQFRGGIQLNGLKLPSSAGNYPLSFGPGIDIGWSPEESKTEFFFNGGYFLPAKSVSTGTIFNGNSSTTVSFTQKTSFIGLGLGGRYFFMDRDENNFNVYATASANLLLGNTKSSIPNPPPGYESYAKESSNNTHQVMISLGLGAEYKLTETGAVFISAQYRFPTGTYNSRTGYDGDLQIPGHPWFSLGYKFTIGGGN